MGKKELIIIVVFSLVGFVGGTFLMKAFKSDEPTEKEKEKTEQVIEENDTVSQDSIVSDQGTELNTSE